MTLHHTPESPCPLCSDKLLQAHSTLQQWFPRIKAEFPSAHISWTFRDEATQNLFCEQGKSRVRWPNSKHNVSPSAAMDLFFLSPDQVALWPKALFQKVADWLKEQGAPLIWGGTFSTLFDADHFQLKP